MPSDVLVVVVVVVIVVAVEITVDFKLMTQFHMDVK